MLLAECIEALRIKPEGVYVDGTLGRAGHSLEIARRLSTGRLICIDRDQAALDAAADKLSAYIKCVEELKAGNNEFRDAATQTRAALEGYGLPEVAYFMETFLHSFSLTLDQLK